MWAMGVLLFVWVAFAVGTNFLGLRPSVFYVLAGNSDAILRGEIWRVLTAGLIHQSSGPGAVEHIMFALLGLYFLAPTLEQRWGSRRTLLFLAGSLVFGFVTQLAAETLLPSSLSARLGQDYWYGSFGALEAVAVAWALSNRGQTVNLFFVLPVTSTGLLLFVVGMSVLRVIAAAKTSEGVFTPFGGMLAGYLFGAGNPTPARRLWLKLRYAWISRRAARYRGANPKLRVIEGERGGGGAAGRKPPTDKRFLN
jgi:membrane associated rhomboid family serine protease